MRRAGKLSAADLTWLLARRVVQWELEVFCMLTKTRLRWVRAMTDLDELCRPTWQTWNHFTLASSFNRCRQRVCSCGLLFEKNTAVLLLEGITLGESIIWQNLCVYHQSVACFVALWVFVLISATTDMSPTADLLVTSILLGKCLSELAWGPSCVVLAWHCAQINQF